MKILILEDETMLRDSMVEYLSGLGHRVDGCHDGMAASDRIAAGGYDLYLLDINVPLKSGFEVIEAIRSRDAMTPVIFVTAMTEIDDITRGYELGCTDYLKKPFKLQELSLRIDQIFKLIGPQRLKRVRLSDRYVFDQTAQMLLDNETEQVLTRRHRTILSVLAGSLGRAVELERFRREVWGRDDIDDATIRAEINRLKKALHEDLIHNIKGIGYKLVAS